MYIESNGTELGFPQHYMRRGWREHLAPGGPGAGMMMQTQAQPGSMVTENYRHPHYQSVAPNYGHPHRRHQMFGEGAGDYVSMMGPGDAAAPPAAVPTSVTAMHPVETPNHMPFIVGGVMVLGLAFVIYKATR